MRNQKSTNVVKFNMSTWLWDVGTVAYDFVSPTSGCLMIWDEKKKEHNEHRPAETGTAAECQAFADQWNAWRNISPA